MMRSFDDCRFLFRTLIGQNYIDRGISEFRLIHWMQCYLVGHNFAFHNFSKSILPTAGELFGDDCRFLFEY